MCVQQLCPDYEGLELGIGESLLMKAVAESTGRTLKVIQKDYHKTGDLGTVAKVCAWQWCCQKNTVKEDEKKMFLTKYPNFILC